MGILQGRILEWVATPSSRGSSQSKYRTPPALQGSPNFLLKINCISNMKSDFFFKSPMEVAEIVEGVHGEVAFH